MSVSPFAEIAATTAQLLAALDRYEADVAILVDRRWDPALYASASHQFDEMQLHVGTLLEGAPVARAGGQGVSIMQAARRARPATCAPWPGNLLPS
jgi:hypothetical protein